MTLSYFDVERLRGAQDRLREIGEVVKQVIDSAPMEPVSTQYALRAALADIGEAALDLEEAILALAPPQPPGAA